MAHLWTHQWVLSDLSMQSKHRCNYNISYDRVPFRWTLVCVPGSLEVLLLPGKECFTVWFIVLCCNNSVIASNNNNLVFWMVLNYPQTHEQLMTIKQLYSNRVASSRHLYCICYQRNRSGINVIIYTQAFPLTG